VTELVAEIDIAYDYLCVPCGTGATLAGLISATADNISLLGFAALKNAGFLNADVSSLLKHSKSNWQINLDYHFGGFASTTPELLNFISAFEAKTTIQLEPVYTGKMMYALYDLISKGHFSAGQRIIAIHTGGLQGDRDRSR
jgi:1-aminocyclopropane-1-carboxylate deaminase